VNAFKTGRSGVILASCLLFHILDSAAAEPSCAPLPTVDGGRKGYRGHIDAPGNYCLQRDLAAANQFDVHAGGLKSFGSEGLISISIPFGRKGMQPRGKDTYTIDLQGHRLAAEPDEMVGIENRLGGLGVTIRNGRIEMARGSRLNKGILLQRYERTPPVKWQQECAVGLKKCEDVPTPRDANGRAPTYANSDYLIEKVSIHAGGRGIEMGGGGNVLRDSVIEVDSRVAVFQFGPHAVIENNTFIVHGKGDKTPFDAVLKLRDADGAIVRNNTFIFEGGFLASAPAAINLLDSKDVLVEGNTFKGFEQKVRVNGDSTYTLK